MKYLLSILLVCAFFATTTAQEYKTYKKVNDSTFVETRNFEEEEAVQLSEDAVLSAFFREMDRWANIESRHYLNKLAAKRVFSGLNRDQKSLISDTTYLEYNSFRDTIYSYPSLQRDDQNDIIYDSEIIIGDTTYTGQMFRTGGGLQRLRLETDGNNYAVKFIRSDKVIRLGDNANLPQLGSPFELDYLRENENFMVYFGIVENKTVRLKIRKR